MGLIKAIAGGVMADQWKEYFYCEAMPANILATKGHKKVTGRSSNYKGDENIITNGSMIAVADGQCMLIVEQGKVVEVCAEPGEFLYDSSTEPSIFSGKLGDGIGDVFRNIGKRFTFGGEAPKDQRVYYFNTKELIGNKYGTASPVPFRVVDQRAAIDIDVGIRCFGEYSYHIANPLLFYTNVCGNVSEDYDRSNLDSQLKTELLTALQPAFAKISEMGIRYSALPGHTVELADALNEALSAKWRDLRGIEVVSFGVSSVTANEEDEKMIKEMQRNAAFMDPTRAQLICDATTAATSCPYCGNPTVVPGQFAGTLKPDFVIPFKLSREDAIQRLKQHYKGKVFLPKSFSSENHLQEISGVYVPFWMFSGEAEGDAHFDATRSRTYKSGDYRITETDHYDAYRAGSLAFEKIPVDGSEKMPDEHMDSIEPYDYSELKPFSTAYLPGFLADKFDVTAEDSRQRADSRCAGTLRSALEKTVSGYETCSARESNTTIKRGKVHYALMPVWMLNTKWRGKDFLFAMNGQTGKLVGDLPVDKGRYWAMFFAIAVPLSAIGSFLAMTLLR